MKKLKNTFLCSLIFFCCFIIIYPYTLCSVFQDEHYFKIRILSKYSLSSVELKIINGYVRIFPAQSTGISQYALTVKISADKETIYAHNGINHFIAKKLQILSADKILLKNTKFCISANNIHRCYKGELTISAHNNKLILINTLNMEEYLKSVVASEMPFSNIEALKAQAVASRTYALTKSDKHKKDGYNFCDLTCCQVYYGADAERPEAINAVNLTQGQILLYNGRAIETFYHSTCGGYLADKKDVFKGKKLPYYSERQDVCNKLSYQNIATNLHENMVGQASCLSIKKEEIRDNCFSSPHYTEWEVSYSSEQMLRALNSYRASLQVGQASCLSIKKDFQGKKYNILNDIKIIDCSPKGIVKEVQINADDKTYKIDGYTFWQTCAGNLGWGGIKSIRFKIYKQNGLYTFKGRGLGHLVGLCQWGSYGMALNGKTYKEILFHYFPETQIINSCYAKIRIK